MGLLVKDNDVISRQPSLGKEEHCCYRLLRVIAPRYPNRAPALDIDIDTKPLPYGVLTHSTI